MNYFVPIALLLRVCQLEDVYRKVRNNHQITHLSVVGNGVQIFPYFMKDSKLNLGFHDIFDVEMWFFSTQLWKVGH